MHAIYFISPFKIRIKLVLLFSFVFVIFYSPAQRMLWADSVKVLLINAKDDWYRSRCLSALITNYMGINLDSSKKYATLALDYALKSNNPRVLARAYKDLAEVAEVDNNPAMQLNYLSDAIKLMDKGKDAEALIKLYFRMSYAYLMLNDVKNAQVFLKKSEDLMESDQHKYYPTNKSHIARVRGVIYLKQKKFTDAAINLKLALKLGIPDKKTTGPWYIASLYVDLAVCEDSLREYTNAGKNFNEALSLYMFLNDHNGIARCKLGLADIAKKRNSDELRLGELQASEKFALKIKDFKHLINVYSAYSSYYGEKKDVENQFLYFRKFSSLNDSLNKLMFNKSLADAKTKFNVDEKERENLILQEKNKALALEKENERNMALLIGAVSLLLILIVSFYAFYTRLKSQKKNLELQYRYLSNQMNPHFIYNALSSVQALAFSGKPMEMVRYISNLSKLIRALFENSKNELITFKEEIESLNLYLALETNKTGRNIQYNIEVPENMDSAFSVPPMLIQPFVENSLKHAFAGFNEDATKKIELTFSKVKGEIVCVIEDNGVGLKTKYDSVPVANHKSSGLKITRDRLVLLCKQYKSVCRLEIKDKAESGQNESGTRVEIVLPVIR